MADGVAITAGSGTTILTDDTGASGHAQIVKLGISADGSPTLIPADATNGIDVDVTRTVPPVPAVVTMQNAATANGAGTSLDVRGYGTAVLDVTGTFVAIVSFEASVDDSNWVAVVASNPLGTSSAIATTAAGAWVVACAGFKSLRANISGYTSGSITVKGAATLPTGASFVSVVNQPVVIAKGSVIHDGDASGVLPLLSGGFASAAAPSDVSADGDAVRAWHLRNGARATALTAAGALIGGDATNGLDVDVTRVKPDGTNTMPSLDAAARRGYVQVTDGTNSATVTNSSLQITGGTAHDGGDAGNPVKIGGNARTTNRTAVSDGDRADFICDDLGRQVVVQGQVRDLIGIQHTQIASSNAETTIVTAIASTFCDLTMLVLTNQTATAVNVTIKDSTAGTTRMIIALAANGGAVLPFPRPVPQATVNNNWTATLSSASVTVNIFAQYEKNV